MRKTIIMIAATAVLALGATSAQAEDNKAQAAVKQATPAAHKLLRDVGKWLKDPKNIKARQQVEAEVQKAGVDAKVAEKKAGRSLNNVGKKIDSRTALVAGERKPTYYPAPVTSPERNNKKK